jgi:hypothetical protein
MEKFGFVEITEKDTGYYKYLADQSHVCDHSNPSEQPFKSSEFPKYIREPSKDSNITMEMPSRELLVGQVGQTKRATKSKNSIFEENFKILKPVTQMTKKELRDFKNSAGVASSDNVSENSPLSEDGDGLVSTPILKYLTPASDDFGITVPLTLPNRQASPTPMEHQPFDMAYLAMNTSQMQAQQHFSQFQSRQNSPSQELSPPPYSWNQTFNEQHHKFPPAENGPLKVDVHQKPTAFRLSRADPIFLSFLPLEKNIIGRGQYSTVYIGHFTTQSQYSSDPAVCAVKRVNDDREALSLAITESYILSRIVHPSIISLLDTKNELEMDNDENFKECLDLVFQNTGNSHDEQLSLIDNLTLELEKRKNSRIPRPRIILVLEYCINGNLWSWLTRHPNKLGKKLWLKWAREIASGIACMHSMGIIHHDLKPHNILVIYCF